MNDIFSQGSSMLPCLSLLYMAEHCIIVKRKSYEVTYSERDGILRQNVHEEEGDSRI